MIKANMIFVLIMTTTLLRVSDFNKSVNEVSGNLSFCDTIHVELQALYDWNPDCSKFNYIEYTPIFFKVLNSSCFMDDSILVNVPCVPHGITNMKINKGEKYNLTITQKDNISKLNNIYDIVGR